MVTWSFGISFSFNFFSATWSQFDGVTYALGNEEGFVARVKNFFSTDKTPEYREMAVLRSLPRWKGFSVVGEEREEMTATEAIEKLKSAIYCFTHNVMEEYGCYPRTFNLPFEKVRGSAKNYVVCLFACLCICLSSLTFWQLLR